TTASGSSTQANGVNAATEAVRHALAPLGGKATFGFVFASIRHKLDEVMRAAREASPGTDFLACTTAGEITERGLTKGGVRAMLVRTDEMVHETAYAGGLKRDHAAAAHTLTARFSQTAASAKAKKLLDSTTVTLIDGLCGVGERVVNGIVHGTRTYQQVVG